METRRTTPVKADDLVEGEKVWYNGYYITIRNKRIGERYVAINDATFGLDRCQLFRVSVPRKRTQDGNTSNNAN